MKKIIALSLMLFALALPICAKAEECDQSILTVNASATETVSPDTANLTFAVETNAKTAQKAAEENRINSQTLYNYLNGFINKKDGDSIKTTSFYVTPQYNYVNNKRELQGYIAQNTVNVETKNIKAVGKIISEALNNGANKVQNVSFSVDENNCYYSVLEKASQKAKEQAQTVAKSLGVNIKGIKRVSSSYNSSFIQPYRAAYADAMPMMAKEAAPMPIEAGDIKITGSVDIDFYLDCGCCTTPCVRVK